MWIWLTAPARLETIGTIVVILFMGAWVLKSIGLVHFGKLKKCETPVVECPDPLCRQNIASNADRIAGIKLKMDKFDAKLDTVCEDLSWVKGYLKNSNGFRVKT